MNFLRIYLPIMILFVFCYACATTNSAKTTTNMESMINIEQFHSIQVKVAKLLTRTNHLEQFRVVNPRLR